MKEQPQELAEQAAEPASTEVESAEVSVEIADDALSAHLRVTRSGSITREELLKNLQAQRVVFGTDHAMCDRICAQVLEEGQIFLIAKGSAALADLPATLKLEFEPDILAGTRRADGTLDFSSRGALTPVAVGQLVATELPPQTGKSGKSVRGEEIAFDKGKSKSKWSLGNNVELDSAGRITSKLDGVIAYEEGGKLDITKHYEHRNPVDMRSGNLHTEGSITVTGDVERNFYVRATEDVEIRGGIIGGSAYACGKIIIGRGAVAGDIGQIIAGGDVFLGHGQEAIIKSAGDLFIERDLVNSDVHARRVIIKNSVVGGLVMAETLIEVKSAGGRGRTRTVLAVATPVSPDFSVPDIASIDAMRARRNVRAHARSVQIGRSMAMTNKDLPKTEQEREARKQLKALEKQLRPTAKIRVTGTVSPGVIIRFGRLQYPIEREMAAMEFSYDMEAKKMVRVPIMPTKG